MAEQGRLSRFLGVWRVKGIYDWRHESPEASQARGLEFLRRGDIWHVLEPDPRFDELKDRLVIVWPETGRHHQWLVHDGALKRQIAVQEIRALGTQQVFPGFDHIVLDYHALCTLVRSDVSGWREPLSSTRGIYLISESETGDMYIGSAMGAEGIWGRWAPYAQTGHGGNKLLQFNIETGKVKIENMRYSVLQTLGNLSTTADGLKAEMLWKKKFGRKAITLNGN